MCKKMFDFKLLSPNFIRREVGATMLETAVALPIVLFFTIVSIDLLRISYHALTLQFIVSDVMRQAIVGESSGAIGNIAKASPAESYANAVERTLINRAAEFGITLNATKIKICTSTTCGTIDDLTGSEKVAQFVVDVPMDGFIMKNYGFGRASLNLQARAAGFLEPR